MPESSNAARPRIKICCIGSIDEAALAIRYGASAVGLVSAMPSGPGVISDAAIAAIARRIPPGVASFLLTSRVDAGEIIEQQRRARVNTVQLCDAVTAAVHARLRDALPGIAIVQVVHVRGDESVAEAVDAAARVDAILLDSGNQSLAVKELGGTGRTHDWRVSRRIVEASPVPVFLAGGLTDANVGDAIRAVRPFGVDVCSGVREAGRLSEAKLARFVAAVAAAA